MTHRRNFIIAGTQSGVGKTIIAIGLMAAIKNRGLIVQPFKAGPDYIDPFFHKLVLKRPSYNLDTWMMGVKGVKKTFANASLDADTSIIEGVMGLFDGHAGCKGFGSTAHIAKVLDLPVILVIDAGKMAQSAGAIVYGFERFDKGVNIVGVIFNRVGSDRHFNMLKTSVEKRCNAKVLGYMPKNKEINLAERHLGLAIIGSSKFKVQSLKFKKIVDLVERHVDVDEILRLSSKPAAADSLIKDFWDKFKQGFKIQSSKSLLTTHNPQPTTRIAVAMDNAFCFYYQENLDILKKLGAELKFFSPLKNKKLPDDINGIYIGGGYPELYTKRLSENKSLMIQIKDLAEKGLPIYAECGGLMYLGNALKDLKNKRYKVIGIFPWTSRMLEKRKAIGYREVAISDEDCPFLDKGQKIRGHEFHYSEIISVPPRIKKVYRITYHISRIMEGFIYKNTLASYIHLHFASNQKFARGFMEKCKKYSLTE